MCEQRVSFLVDVSVVEKFGKSMSQNIIQPCYPVLPINCPPVSSQFPSTVVLRVVPSYPEPPNLEILYFFLKKIFRQWFFFFFLRRLTRENSQLRCSYHVVAQPWCVKFHDCLNLFLFVYSLQEQILQIYQSQISLTFSLPFFFVRFDCNFYL